MSTATVRRLATTRLQDTAEALKAQHPGLVLDLHRRGPDTVVLETISVPAGRRRTGVGSAALRALCAEADRLGLTVELVVYDGLGTPRAALVKFYRDHGFVRKFARSSATMLRIPRTAPAA